MIKNNHKHNFRNEFIVDPTVVVFKFYMFAVLIGKKTSNKTCVIIIVIYYSIFIDKSNYAKYYYHLLLLLFIKFIERFVIKQKQIYRFS